MGSICALLCNRMRQEMDIDHDGGPLPNTIPGYLRMESAGGEGATFFRPLNFL